MCLASLGYSVRVRVRVGFNFSLFYAFSQCGVCTVWGMYSVGCVQCTIIGCAQFGVCSVGCVHTATSMLIAQQSGMQCIKCVSPAPLCTCVWQ